MKIKSINRRQQLIVRKLEMGAANFRGIRDYIFRATASDDETIDLNLRTFQRDLKVIYNLHGVEIAFDRSMREYHIVNDERTAREHQLLDHLAMINLLEIGETAKHLFFQHRQPRGVHFFGAIIKAIREKRRLFLTHKKHWDQKKTYEILPLALREYKGNWYLVAIKITEAKRSMRTYGVDRVLEVANGDIDMDYPSGFDCDTYFFHSFGIIRPENGKPEKVVLKFDEIQSGFVRHQPFHRTQKVIADNGKTITISIKVFITFELIHELRGLGGHVRVVEPENLKLKL